MKFKYIGENNTYCLELLAYNIMSKKDNLKKGDKAKVTAVKDGVVLVIEKEK